MALGETLSEIVDAAQQEEQIGWRVLDPDGSSPHLKAALRRQYSRRAGLVRIG